MDFLALLFLKTVWSFAFGILIERNRDTPRAKLLLAIGIGGCLTVLGVFKYLNFFVDSFAAILGTTPSELGVHWRMILPIGISFFIFQAISYLIDVCRKEVVATRNFVDFAAFVALFPQLIAGPILRFKDLEQQFVTPRHSFELFSEGVTRFAIGLAQEGAAGRRGRAAGRRCVRPAGSNDVGSLDSARWPTCCSCISTSPVTATWPSAWA